MKNKRLSGAVKAAIFSQLSDIEINSKNTITANSFNNNFTRAQVKSHREYLLHLIEKFKNN